MANQRVSVGEALRFAGGYWRRATPKALAPLVVLGLVTFVLSPAFHVVPLLSLALLAVELVVLVVAQGALMREAMEDRHPGDGAYRIGPAGLQWTGIETAILGAVGLLALFLALVSIGGLFAFVLVAVVVASTSGQQFKPGAAFFATPSGIAAEGVVLLIALATAWAYLRLYLSVAATVDRRRVQVFSTWSLTKGQVLPLLAAVVAVNLPTLILSFAAHQLSGEDPGVLTIGLWLLYGLVFGLAYVPLSAGVAAYFYRQLSAPVENA